MYTAAATTALTTIASAQMISASLRVRADRLVDWPPEDWLGAVPTESSGEGWRGSLVVTSNHREPFQ
jgi:hypothetical protein